MYVYIYKGIYAEFRQTRYWLLFHALSSFLGHALENITWLTELQLPQLET